MIKADVGACVRSGPALIPLDGVPHMLLGNAYEHALDDFWHSPSFANACSCPSVRQMI